jgi:hypothetical protein
MVVEIPLLRPHPARSPHNPVYPRRLDPSVLAISLSVHRHVFICILCSSHFTCYDNMINTVLVLCLVNQGAPYLHKTRVDLFIEKQLFPVCWDGCTLPGGGTLHAPTELTDWRLLSRFVLPKQIGGINVRNKFTEFLFWKLFWEGEREESYISITEETDTGWWTMLGCPTTLTDLHWIIYEVTV